LRSFAPLFRFPKNKKKKRTKEKKERKLRLPADRKCRYQTRTICGGITGHTRDGLVPDCFFSFISIERRRKKTKTTREIKETNTQKPKTIGNRGASPVTRREEESFDFLFFTFFPISAKSEMLFYFVLFFDKMFSQKHTNNRVPRHLLGLFSLMRCSRFISFDLNSPFSFDHTKQISYLVYYYVHVLPYSPIKHIAANYIFCHDITKFNLSLCVSIIHANG
jgi:hypothetical protein